MKKSQLRQLIRESIKELVNEQWTPGISVRLRTCTGGASYGNFCVPSSQLSPQIGDAIHITNYWVPNWNNRKAFITEIHGSCNVNQTTSPTTVVPWTGSCPNCCHSSWHGTQTSPQGACWATCGNTNPTPCTVYGCTDPTAMNYNSTILPNCDQGCVYAYQFGCTDSTASNYDPAAIYDDGSCTISPIVGCDPSAPFPPNFNLASWTNTWTSLPNFSNTTNPNQPCNLICQRKNQWTSQLAAGGMGPKQTNMVSCKLEEAEAQYLTHNCATSNANNCP
jgi:hypothetical protein